MNNEYPSQNGRSHNGGDMRVVRTCPVCQTSYYPWQAQVLEERQEAHLIYVECHKCGSGQVALILTSATGVSTLGLVTDLSPTDVVKFTNSTPVSVDDVMEMHQLLERHSAALLAQLV